MLTVTWKVDDGYTNNRPHVTKIQNYEFEECETEQDRNDIIDQAVQADFEQLVSWYIVSTKKDSEDDKQ